jgi:hypothetical protein
MGLAGLRDMAEEPKLPAHEPGINGEDALEVAKDTAIAFLPRPIQPLVKLLIREARAMKSGWILFLAIASFLVGLTIWGCAQWNSKQVAELKSSLREIKQERDTANTRLAPFIAQSEKLFTNVATETALRELLAANERASKSQERIEEKQDRFIYQIASSYAEMMTVRSGRRVDLERRYPIGYAIFSLAGTRPWPLEGPKAQIPGFDILIDWEKGEISVKGDSIVFRTPPFLVEGNLINPSTVIIRRQVGAVVPLFTTRGVRVAVELVSGSEGGLVLVFGFSPGSLAR